MKGKKPLLKEQLQTIQDQEGNDDMNQDQNHDRDHKKENLCNSKRLGILHWFQQKHVTSGSWQQQEQNETGVAWCGQDSWLTSIITLPPVILSQTGPPHLTPHLVLLQRARKLFHP
jgi:hypothetical protein